MKRSNLLRIVEGGIFIALSMILDYIKIWKMPQGGSVTALAMLPLILYSQKWGIKNGLLASTTFGVLKFLLSGGFSLHPLSIIFDYLVGFGVLGFAGAFRGNKEKATLGAALAIFLRFVSVFISGAFVWYIYAPEGMNPYLYSFIYNITYMGPELLLTCIVLYLIYPKFEKFLKTKN